MGKIENKIEIYQKKVEELKSIRSEIERQHAEFRNFMRPQKDYLNEKKSELNKYLDDNIIKIRLGDFIEVLSLIVDVEKNTLKYDIKTNMYYIGKYQLKNTLNKDKKIKYYCNSYPMVMLSLFIKEKEYIICYKMDVNEIQYDGKKMIDHCSARIIPDTNYLVGYKTDIVIDKNVDDIIINFNLYNLSCMNDSELIMQTLNKYNNKVKKIGGKK